MKPSYIHEPGDGRGPRDVFLNDRRLDAVLYANERRGVVKVARQPFKVDKHGKRILARTMHGTVRVEPKA